MTHPLPGNHFNPKLLRGSLFSGAAEHPGTLHAREVARRARENPGEWFDFAVRMANKKAISKASSMRRRPQAAFKPVGAYEVVAEGREDGWAIRVRFVGWPP